MNAYLGGLIARNLAPTATAVRPRLRSLFETPPVPGIGDPFGGEGLAESTVERFAQSPTASPRGAIVALPAPMAPEPAASAAPSVAPVARIAPPPEANPLTDAAVERNRETRRTDDAREPSSERSAVSPPMPWSSQRVDRGHPIAEQPAAQHGGRVQPATPSPERLVVER